MNGRGLTSDEIAEVTPEVTAEVSAVLAQLDLRPRGPARAQPSPPAGIRRRVLHVPVTGLGPMAGVRAVVVVKFVPSTLDIEVEALGREHQIGGRLHALAAALGGANPVPRVLHVTPVEVGGLLVGVREYIAAQRPMCAREFGSLLGRLHQIGASPEARTMQSHPGTPFLGLDVDRLASALRRSGSPFGADPLLGERVVRALRARLVRARDMDLAAGEPPLLVHRDLHPGNVVLGSAGPVAIDWAEAGWGARGEDFAWLQVAVTRFGANPSVLDDAFAGYADVTGCRPPGRAQVRAWGQVRELVCLAYSLQNAGRSEAHLREAHLELPIIDDPDAQTAGWTPLFNPTAFTHPMLRDRFPQNGSRQIQTRKIATRRADLRRRAS